MESNKLLAEIVLKVVEFLEDDITTLHSCILVNREWCKITIPILWNNTFRQHKQHKPCHSPEGCQIVSTYIAELSGESKDSLSERGVIFPATLTQRRMLFEYSRFLRHLDMYYLKLFVRSWLYFTTRDTNRRYTSDQIQEVSVGLLNHFLRKTPYLISLKFTNSDTTEPIITALQEVPEAKGCLSKLKTINQYHRMHPVKTTLFSRLSNFLWNLEHVDIAIDTRLSELLKFISAQRNLKRLSLRNKGMIMSDDDPWVLGVTESPRKVLITHLKLEMVNFPLVALYEFENLIELELKTCGHQGYSREDLIHFSRVSLKHLEVFYFESKYPIYLESFADLITNSGKNLLSLTLHGCQIEDPENARKLVISLANHSPNLTYYDGPILEDNVCELDLMLDRCVRLGTLFLHPSIPRCFSPTPSINFDPLFHVITHNKSHRLKWLAIIHAWQISKDALLDFFETHKKKNLGPIKFNYERTCTVFHGISEICTKYDNIGVGQDCKIFYCSKYHL